MKESITICDRCNLNVNDAGPRAGEIKATNIRLSRDGVRLTDFDADLCEQCTEEFKERAGAFIRGETK